MGTEPGQLNPREQQGSPNTALRARASGERAGNLVLFCPVPKAWYLPGPTSLGSLLCICKLKACTPQSLGRPGQAVHPLCQRPSPWAPLEQLSTPMEGRLGARRTSDTQSAPVGRAAAPRKASRAADPAPHAQPHPSQGWGHPPLVSAEEPTYPCCRHARRDPPTATCPPHPPPALQAAVIT